MAQEIFTIWIRNGQVHPTFTDYEQALEYMRVHVLASPEVHTTDWYTTNAEDGLGQCCYATRDEVDADQDGAYAPTINRDVLAEEIG